MGIIPQLYIHTYNLGPSNIQDYTEHMEKMIGDT